MKILRILFFSGILALACGLTTLTAQVTMGSHKEPEAFSVLELISNNNKGMRLPQMDSVQRKAMQATAAFQTAKTGAAMGLQIFNTDTKCVETWNGTKWIQACAPHVNDIIPDNKGGDTWENYQWVGAFWRDSQTGERVIASKVATPAATTWTVEVDNPTGTGAWLTLEASGGNDKKLWTETPDDAENHQLPSTRVTNISGSGHILFRIGATSKNSNTDASYNTGKKPRYATVTVRVTVNNGAPASSTLYCRQGESADYVFALNESTPSSTTFTGPRTKAKKFSPYNLTNKDIIDPATPGDAVAGVFTGVASDPATYRGDFVDYPTKSGAHFKWGVYNTADVTYAYHPDAPITNWTTNGSTDIWDNIKATNETCPSGWRRPNDGPTDVFIGNTNISDFASSECRQSLFLTPRIASGIATTNSLYGYYADGYFDRRPIMSSTTNLWWPNSTVAEGTKEVAFIGNLFYNSATLTSLFFPSCGYRQNASGISSEGRDGGSWSSSIHLDTSILGWYIRTPQASMVRSRPNSDGLSIRCVVE